jgi:hypothetical protein
MVLMVCFFEKRMIDRRDWDKLSAHIAITSDKSVAVDGAEM